MDKQKILGSRRQGVQENIQKPQVRLDLDLTIPFHLQDKSLKRGNQESSDGIRVKLAGDSAAGLRVGN